MRSCAMMSCCVAVSCDGDAVLYVLFGVWGWDVVCESCVARVMCARPRGVCLGTSCQRMGGVSVRLVRA